MDDRILKQFASNKIWFLTNFENPRFFIKFAKCFACFCFTMYTKRTCSFKLFQTLPLSYWGGSIFKPLKIEVVGIFPSKYKKGNIFPGYEIGWMLFLCLDKLDNWWDL